MYLSSCNNASPSVIVEWHASKQESRWWLTCSRALSVPSRVSAASSHPSVSALSSSSQPCSYIYIILFNQYRKITIRYLLCYKRKYGFHIQKTQNSKSNDPRVPLHVENFGSKDGNNLRENNEKEKNTSK